MTTTVTLRPASTITSSGITLFGGAGSLHATLADNTDTTYGLCDHGYGEIRFDTLTVPAGGVIQWINLRMRSKRVSAATTLYASVNGHTPTQFHPAAGYGDLSSTSLAAAISNADLTAGVTLLWACGEPADISAAYLDVIYAAVPTLNVTAPTGTIGVSQPTATWTVSGDFPQERFQIKVFSSAQYGAAGFNVDRSTPLYNSGELVGSTGTYVPLLYLSNSDTYRYYVRVAQRTGSHTQWSAWDYSTTTVDVAAAEVPALTMTANPTSGSIKIVATVSGSAPLWEFVQIERTADGATWTPVRSADSAPVAGIVFRVYDFEAGNSEAVQYRARSIIADPAGDIASEWSAPSAPIAWKSPDAWLKSPTNPSLNRPVTIGDIPAVTRRIPRNSLDVLGRPDPIVVTDIRKWIEGNATFVALSDTQADDIRALLATGETLLLQTPANWGFGSRYISCGDVTENRTSTNALETSRIFDVPFQEVIAPVGQVFSYGITWDDVIDGYADWDAVAAFATWFELLAVEP